MIDICPDMVVRMSSFSFASSCAQSSSIFWLALFLAALCCLSVICLRLTGSGLAKPHILLQALATAQRQPFTLDWSRTKKEIADEKAGILPPPLVLKLPAMPIAEKPGKKQRRSSGVKGKSTGQLSAEQVLLSGPRDVLGFLMQDLHHGSQEHR